MRAVSIGLVVGGVLLATSAANAQTNQIKPRVMIMLDTSGSMTQHIDSGTNSGADGSLSYSDAVMTRDVASFGSLGMYPGIETGAATCPSAGPFDGGNSRMYNGKVAITNVVNGSGDIDWGLMRYTGFDCPLLETFTPQVCAGNAACRSNSCTATHCNCTSDDQCLNNQFCIGPVGSKICGTVDNLCENNGYVGTSKRNNGSCASNGQLPVTYGGDSLQNKDATNCGVGAAAGSATCATKQTCNGDADCAGGAGSCVTIPGGVAKACKCTTVANCPAATYNSCTGGFCVYAGACQSIGGQVVVDPAAVGFSNNQMLPFVDNVEDYSIGATKSGAAASIVAGAAANNARISGLTGMLFTDIGKAIQISGANSAANNGYFTITNFVNATTVDVRNNVAVVPDTKNGTISWNVKYPVNPELRAINNTPLAGAARTATSWYNSVIGSDPVAQCRPYVLVQITDGFDTCEGSATLQNTGPVAAAQGFVAATVPGKPSKPLNKVYVIGLNLSSPTLDAIAAAGGTGTARLATSQQDIEAALADIVSSSVLVEKCNGVDDNCNGKCDENFPGVAKTDPSCTNPKATPDSCDNGLLGQCLATGTFQCSADQLSQVCVTPTCTPHAGGTISSPAPGTMRIGSTVGGAAVGQVIFVSGSTKIANNGGFVVTAAAGANIDVSNPGVVVPDASSVTYAIPPTQGAGTVAVAGGVVTLTVASTNGVAVGANIFILGGAAGNNGQFTVSAVTATTITYSNAAAVAGAVTWAVDICLGVETCNGLDDNCDGIIDNCGDTNQGSCCTSSCPACAKAPFIETCNGCDDDCDGIIDNPKPPATHLVDVGFACNNTNVGDCTPGISMCCQQNPDTGVCTQDQNPATSPTNDKVWCKNGNSGYPVLGADLCDGTDDNCNSQINDGPPQICLSDNAGHTLPGGKDGVGVCHHGLAQCQTVAYPPGDPRCPAGWPAGKSCPASPPVYDPTCPGLVVPSPEFCDGLDNDCNACIDDNPQDAWINTDCCSTGNLADCDNTLTGSRCKRGKWQCAQPGGACTAGAKTCVGSVAKAVETCNMIDDDCNGAVDDVPGVGAPCTGPGIFTGGECKAVEQCVAGNMAPQCVQTQGPVMETCNGKDDNCNGLIDDNMPPLAVNPLPGVGVPCMVPIPPVDKPPCKAGTTVCIAGGIVCQGAVGPMPNQCNGISTDCTGNPNTNGNCPTGFQCYQGNCVAPCQPGEFPCPGGYACDLNTNSCDMNGNHVGCCVPDACTQITCPLGFNCKLDAQGMASCIDPCTTVTCPASYICKLGACVDGSCRTQGCPDGQVCKAQSDNTFACEPDPCADVTCGMNQFCQAGVCVGACAGPCPNGQYCNQGQCVPNPCAHTPCVEGQVCRVQGGVAVCVENQCQFGCNIGQACCGGECVADGCENLHCPEDTHC
ncbi:MAG: MopE-related protein, partial [Polyangia bacterium]